MFSAESLPIIYLALMGIAIFMYAILDGYDLGVGILLPMKKEEEQSRDILISSIGPFWDANETWLVLAVGLLLIAFPAAHNMILFHLYLPATFMLISLILRGVAFDFRAKAAVSSKLLWDRTFKGGSILTALSQGYMLGYYVSGFSSHSLAIIFSILSAIGVCAAYAYIGSNWLILKTENGLQKQFILKAQLFGRLCFIGIVGVTWVNLLISESVYTRWFESSLFPWTLAIPSICIACFVCNEILYRRLPLEGDRYCWAPFVLAAGIFACSFFGLSLSFYPDIVPGKLTIWQAIAAEESLRFLLYGAIVVVPIILLYTFYSYYVFYGKASKLDYY